MSDLETNQVDRYKMMFVDTANKIAPKLFPDFKACEWEFAFHEKTENQPWSFYLPSIASNENEAVSFLCRNNSRQTMSLLAKNDAAQYIGHMVSVILMEHQAAAEAEGSDEPLIEGLYDFAYDMYFGIKRNASTVLLEILD